MKNFRIWHISDTHRKHGFLDVPDDIDMAIHSGDAGTSKEPAMNNNEMLDFFEWFASLTHIRTKIFSPGNHDTSLEAGLITRGMIPESIVYLDHQFIEIEGLKIFASPYTPAFGRGWSYNVPRDRMHEYWKDIPEGLDILITHGPPKGILDLTQYDSRPGTSGQSYFQCGCQSLLDRVEEVEPRFHLFGHIHSEESCPNSGMFKLNGLKTVFINSAVVDVQQVVANNGHVFEINKQII